MSLPSLLTDRAVLAQVLSLAAVHISSKRWNREYTAVLKLTPPSLTEEEKDKAKTQTEAETTAPITIRRPWYRRFFSKKTAMAMIPMLVFAFMQFFFIWVLPRISSKLVLDVFWASLSGWILSQALSSVLLVTCCGQLAVSLVKGQAKGYNIKQEPASLHTDRPHLLAKKRNRQIASAILAGGVVALTYYDQRNLVLPFASAAWIMHLYASIVIPKASMRVFTKMTVGFVLGCAALIGIVMTIVTFFVSSSAGGTKKSSSNVSDPDPWVLTLMMLPQDLIVTVPVALLVSLTLRYDHHHRSSPTLETDALTKAAPGERVTVPRSIESRPTPLYNIALGSLAACHVISDLVVHHLYTTGVLTAKAGMVSNELEASKKLGSFILGNTLVPFVIAFAAWCRGELGSWWGYYEEWIPQVEDETIEQSEINDAEKALDETEVSLSAKDEKKAIPVI